MSSNIERFSQFLTLVGLTALVVGGVGVANAVRAYLDGKRGVIATFKSLGASGGFVFLVYLVQIMLIATLGIAIGLVVGAAMPYVAGALLSSVIPVPAEGGLYPAALAMAALFGFLVTLAFALLPLGRARDVPATALFREMGFEGRGLPRLVYIAAAGLIALALAGVAVWFSDDRRIALIFVGATIFAFIVLRSVGVGVQWIARRGPRIGSTALRLAVGNIHRPGALTPSVVLSLGLGLTLLVTLALIDGDLRRQISGSLTDARPTSSSWTSRPPRSRPSMRWSARRRRPASWSRCRCCAAASWRSTASTRRSCRCRRGRLGAARRPRPDVLPTPFRKTPRSFRANGGRRAIPASRSSRSRPTKARRSG